MQERNRSSRSRLMSTPSRRMLPSVTDQSRGINESRVVFPDPVRPTMATRSPALIGEAHVAKRRLGAPRVGKRQPAHLEGRAAVRFRRRDGIVGFGNSHRSLEDLVDPAHRRRASLKKTHDPPQGDGRPGHQAEQRHEGHERAERALAGDDATAARPEDDERAEAGDHRDERVEEAEGPGQAHVPGEVLAVRREEHLALRFFEPVGLHDADAGEILLGDGVQPRLLHLHVEKAAVVELRGQVHHQRDRRHRQQGPERQHAVEGEHHRDRDHEGEDGVRQLHDPRPDHHAHRFDVGGGAAHQVAGAVALKERRRLREESAEHEVAQVELDLARNADDQQPRPVAEDALEQGGAEDQQAVPQQGRRGSIPPAARRSPVSRSRGRQR